MGHHRFKAEIFKTQEAMFALFVGDLLGFFRSRFSTQTLLFGDIVGIDITAECNFLNLQIPNEGRFS